MVARVFARVEVDSWDEPLLTLPDHAAVTRYLIGHLADPAIADTVTTPLQVTKRGSLIWASKH